MFGHRKDRAGGDPGQIRVELALEEDLTTVAQSVARYLADPSGAARQSLLAALEELDGQAGLSDAYEGSVIGSGAVGYAARGEVLGETGIDPVVDEVPGAELQAQVALVAAAKNELRRPTAETLAALRAASQTLAAAREHGAPGS